jgi:hypothetical protein
MENQEFSQPFQEMVAYQKKILAALEKNANAKKDMWDRVPAISTFVSGVIIAAIGLYFTHSYNSRQNDARAYEARVQEMQTVEKFIPHLIGTDEAAKKGAIIAVATLGSPQLASRLGALYASPGTIDAIEVLLKTAEGETKTSLEASLVNAYFTRGKILIDNGSNLEQAVRDYDRIQKNETDEAIKQ